jgi:hypothetical protein
MKTHPYVKDIPEGYRYCSDCELLTPHTLDREEEDHECDICGHVNNGFDVDCPNCGWEHDPDRDLSPETIKVKKHSITCLQEQRKHEDELETETECMAWLDKISCDEFDCNCPEVDCYPIQNIFNYSSTPAHWNMECSNAMEWSYEIMCPICNEVFEVDDGNC